MALFIIHEEVRDINSQSASAYTFAVAADNFDDAVAKIAARHKQSMGRDDPAGMTRTHRAMKVEGDCAEYVEIQAEHEPVLMLLHGPRRAERELGYYCPVCKETRSDRRNRLAADRAARKKNKK